MEVTYSPQLQTSKFPLEAQQDAQSVHTSRAFRLPPKLGPYSDFHPAICPRFHIPLALSILGIIPRGKPLWRSTEEVNIARDT